MTMATQAVEGIEVETFEGVTRVRDGETTWYCREADFDAALFALSDRAELSDDSDGTPGHVMAYAILCDRVRGVVAGWPGIGVKNGSEREAADLILAWHNDDEDQARALENCGLAEHPIAGVQLNDTEGCQAPTEIVRRG